MTISSTFADGLFPHQLTAAMRIVNQRRVLIADSPGAGKTAAALVALEADGQFTRQANILICTQMNACTLTWGPEIKKRVATQYDVIVADLTDPGHRKTPPSLALREQRLANAWLDAQVQGKPLVVIANFEMLRRLPNKVSVVQTLWDIQWDTMILDESHLVLPTQTDDPMKMTQFWRGLRKLQFSHDPILLPMSGTPDRGELQNRYGTWKFLYPNHFTDYWGWARRQFVVGTEVVPRKGGEIEVAKIGKVRSEERWAEFDRHLMLRRTKAELFKDMPAKRWADDGGVDLPLTVAQEQAYADYQERIQQKYEEYVANDQEGRAQALKMQFWMRSRQMATCTWDWVETVDEDGKEHMTGKPRVAGPTASNKLAWLLEWMESRGHMQSNWDATLGKVVIVSYFVQVLKWLKAELADAGITAEVLSGQTPSVDKVRIQDDFREGDLRVVLLSGTLGVSINLDSADDMIFMDLVQDPDAIEQAEDRIHRASRMHQVTYWRLLSENTIDPAVAMIVDSKYQQTRHLMDGMRGVEFARLMMPSAMKEAA